MCKKVIGIMLSLAMLNSMLAMTSFAAERSEVGQQTQSFEDILNEKGISVTGTGGTLSGAKVASIVGDETPEIAKKFLDGTRNAVADKAYTPVELLELQYYSLPVEERARFLDEAANNTIKVQMASKGVIFSSLSYGSKSVEGGNTQRATENYTSTGRATATIDDGYGDTKSLTLRLTGNFRKTTNGDSWEVSYVSHSKDDDIDMDIHEVGDSVVTPPDASGSGTFYGDEIFVSRLTQWSYGFGSADINMYVYPKAAYNENDITIY